MSERTHWSSRQEVRGGGGNDKVGEVECEKSQE